MFKVIQNDIFEVLFKKSKNGKIFRVRWSIGLVTLSFLIIASIGIGLVRFDQILTAVVVVLSHR